MNRASLPITMQNLTEDWRIWIGDSSLQSTLRFGQYVLNKHLASGYAWAECYYASTEVAWQMLFNWVNNTSPSKYPKLIFH